MNYKNILIKVIALAIMSWLTTGKGEAQSYIITGKVIDSLHSNISGNALLFSRKGDQIIRGTFFENNTFKLTADAIGSYYIRISSIGYGDLDIPLEIMINPFNYDLGDIAFSPQQHTLHEIIVTASRPLFERTDNGTRLNIANTMLSKSANAAELLSKSPGVSITANKVNVFGSGEAVLYQQGKEIPFETFKSLPPGEIQSIEFITNPSAKFDAKGKAVILVIMKKSYRQGLSTTLTNGTTFGFIPNQSFGHHNMNNASINLDYKKDKISLTGYYANDLGATWNENYYNTFITSPEGLYKTRSYYNETSHSNQVHYYKFGIGTELNDKSDFSLQYDGLYHFFNLDVAQNGDYYTPGNALTSIRMTNDASTTLINHSANANYNYRLDTLGGTLFIGAQINRFENRLLDQIIERTTDPSLTLTKAYRINDGNNAIHLFTAQADLSKKLKSGITIDLGAKFSKTTNEGTIRFSSKTEAETHYTEDPRLANKNLYTEYIPAIYASISGSRKSWSWNAGLRIENTVIDALNQKTNETRYSKNYIDGFPSAKLSYKVNTLWNTSLSYARKINRPIYQDLDPFLWYLDALTSIRGNPNLQPEYLNQLEWRISHHAVTFKVGYTRSDNTIWAITRPGTTGPNSTIFIKENIQHRNLFKISLELPIETAHYNAFNSIAYNLNQFKDNRPEFNTGITTPQLYIYTYHQWLIPNLFNLDLTGEYYGTSADGFTHKEPYYYLTLGVSKSFLKDNLNLQLQFNDLFNTARFKGIRTIGTVTNDYNQRFLSHYIRLTGTYKLGNLKEIKYKNKAINEKEFNRIKQ